MKVSVLIPVYNSEQYLADAIASVLGQTWQNKELIIVDDGSTDESLAIARRFESDTVKVIGGPNQGACAARNTAFRNSSGDFIQYLDADDILERHKIERQVTVMREAVSGDALLSGRWLSFTSQITDAHYSSKQIDRSYPNATDWLCDAWNKGEMGQTGVWLIPRNLHEKTGFWDESLKKNQDGEFFARMIVRASSIVHVPDAITYYRRGVTGAISNKFSYDAAKSELSSYISYRKQVIGAGAVDPCLQSGLKKVFAFFLYVYAHQYADLKQEAMRYYDDIEGKSTTEVGGRLFSKLCRFAGFKNALLIRSMLNKLRVS